MKKRIAAACLASLMGIFCVTGCGGGTDQNPSYAQETVQEDGQDAEQAEETEEVSQNETDSVSQDEQDSASKEEQKNAEDTAILVVSFGTSYNESRDLTIGAIEKRIADAFPEYEVRRAFTSQIIIDKLKERDGLEIDNVEEALDRAVADGIKNLIVQPTHLMDGYEYTDLSDALENYKDKLRRLRWQRRCFRTMRILTL